MESTMDRRSFLKGSVLAGAVASTGMLLGGCAPKKESESAVEKNGKSAGDGGAVDWLGAPQTIDEGDIAETLECDVLVIGGGLSGLCALNAAVEEGANAILIEKHSCSRYGGIFHSAIGYEKQVEAGVTLDPEEVLNNELVKYGPLCDTSFWATWAHESGAIMDWLLEKAEANGVVIGMPFTQYPEGVDPSKEPYITIPGSFTTGWDHFIEEGKEREKYLLDALTSEAVKSGAQVKYNTPVCTWSKRITARWVEPSRRPKTGRICGSRRQRALSCVRGTLQVTKTCARRCCLKRSPRICTTATHTPPTWNQTSSRRVVWIRETAIRCASGQAVSWRTIPSLRWGGPA